VACAQAMFTRSRLSSFDLWASREQLADEASEQRRGRVNAFNLTTATRVAATPAGTTASSQMIDPPPNYFLISCGK